MYYSRANFTPTQTLRFRMDFGIAPVGVHCIVKISQNVAMEAAILQPAIIPTLFDNASHHPVRLLLLL